MIIMEEATAATMKTKAPTTPQGRKVKIDTTTTRMPPTAKSLQWLLKTVVRILPTKLLRKIVSSH